MFAFWCVRSTCCVFRGGLCCFSRLLASVVLSDFLIFVVLLLFLMSVVPRSAFDTMDDTRSKFVVGMECKV